MDPGLRALLDDLARMDGVVLPSPAHVVPRALGEAPDLPSPEAAPVADVVDLAAFRARRRR